MSDHRADTDVDRVVDDEQNPHERGKWLSAVLALLGAWMLVAAVWFDVVPGQFWNDVVVGVLLLAVGGYNYYRRGNDEAGSVGAAALAAVIGLWLVAAPFVFSTGGTAVIGATGLAFWNDVVVGLIALGVGVFSAYAAHDRQRGTAGAASGR